MIRLCAFDLDGTLLDSHGILSADTAKAVRELFRSGAAIALVSGRPPCYTNGFFLQMGIRGFSASSNGAFITSPSGDIIRNNPFPAQLTAELTVMLEKHGARYALQTQSGIIGNRAASASISERFVNYRSMMSSFGLDVRLPETVSDIGGRLIPDVLKIAVTGGNLALTEYRSLISSSFPFLAVSFSGDTVLDINLPSDSKGSALVAIAEVLDVCMEDICCFGDYNNDIPMFRHSGFSIAMGNAGDAFKTEVDFIEKTNDEDGVAETIRRILLPMNRNEV